MVDTLWGKELINPAPKCNIKECHNPADNAGYGKYHKLCSFHHKKKYKMKGWHYKTHRKEYCENSDGRLGFVCDYKIVMPNWQLEVDHIDGNKENNEISNLQTLCANCHRYKTYMNSENLTHSKRKKLISEVV